ncbi:17320_t:CDS:2, partial [Acaulospora colombiana]
KSTPIEPKVDEESGTGIGRLVVLKNPLPLSSLYPIIKKHLGVPYIQVAKSYKEEISTIAVCAGSGGSVLKDVQADLYWTGEMSHHEVLAAVAKGTNLSSGGHTNTERGYLEQLKGKLQKELASDGSKAGLQVQISKTDRDPLETRNEYSIPTWNMAEFNPVDPQDGWEYDLHSVKSKTLVTTLSNNRSPFTDIYRVHTSFSVLWYRLVEQVLG